MAHHLLAAYRCVIHLPLGPQSSGAREVGEPGGSEGVLSLGLARLQPGVISMGRVNICLPAFGASVLKVRSDFRSLSFSLVLTLTPLILLRVSFLSFRPVMG